MSAPNYIQYTITKTAANTYEMKLKVTQSTGGKQLQTNIVLSKTDADGTITVEKSPIPTASVVSDVRYPNNFSGYIDENSRFYCNLDTDNVAIGGTVYEIEEFSGGQL